MSDGTHATKTRELLWVFSEQRVRGSRMVDFLTYVNRDRDVSHRTQD